METMLRSVAMSGYFDVTRRVGLSPVELAQQLGIDTVKTTVDDLAGRPEYLVPPGCAPMKELI